MSKESADFCRYVRSDRTNSDGLTPSRSIRFDIPALDRGGRKMKGQAPKRPPFISPPRAFALRANPSGVDGNFLAQFVPGNAAHALSLTGGSWESGSRGSNPLISQHLELLPVGLVEPFGRRVA